MNGIELWAGVECTVNRVEGKFFDQLSRNGHARRIEDLDRFAELGIRVLRTPILWERTAPTGVPDFRWADERMQRMRLLGIRPIVGLVHHGSGPAFTSLVDPAFPERLAAYARQVAERYPDALEWTPINEPLTTARFSGLYGHWFPHGRDEGTCFRALVMECRATVLAMRAIREVIPNARLVQTEDLGRTFSTRALAYQAEYENERRWLSFDLLFGRVDRPHPLWRHLMENGVTEEELDFFREGDAAPSVIGINYYVTSDRYLDERVQLFPDWTRGGNGRHAYADIEAVRVRKAGIVGHEGALWDAWERFKAPVAITEVHLGCTREEQLRWLFDAWTGAAAAKARGADVRAVTAWSLLGAHDWNSLLVKEGGFYESGAFDVRVDPPRPTALAHAIKGLANDGRLEHPVLEAPGWWRRPERILYRASLDAADIESTPAESNKATALRGAQRPLVITGAGGLARAVAHACSARAISHRLMPRALLDIGHEEAVARALDRLRPWAVVNAAGRVLQAASAEEEVRMFRDNAHAAAVLARACAERGIPLVTFSSEHVFDGRKGSAYHERDVVSPITPYGRSKAQAEQDVLAIHEKALVIRTGQVFGPWSQRDAVRSIVRRLSAEGTLFVEETAVVSPTYSPDLANAALDLLLDAERGVWHLSNVGAVTLVELARETAAIARLDRASVVAVAADVPITNTSLTSERGLLLPSLGDGLQRYFSDHAFGELVRSVA